MMMKYLFLILLIAGCSLKQPEAKTDLPMEDLKAAQQQRIADALAEFDDGNGRLAPILEDCDGTIWQGQWCAVTGCSLSDYREGGRWYRRPEPRCWTEDGGPDGSATTYSRDMEVCGAIPYMLFRGTDRMAIERLEYLKGNDWYSGEPKSDKRTYFTPQMKALVTKAAEHLGVPADKNQYWPSIYLSGLTDYHAHLQMCNIWARGHIEGKVHSAMLDRAFEHHKRLPDLPLYSVIYGIYSGKTGKAVENCLREEPYHGDYIRCGKHPRACGYATHTFACQILIDAYD